MHADLHLWTIETVATDLRWDEIFGLFTGGEKVARFSLYCNYMHIITVEPGSCSFC